MKLSESGAAVAQVMSALPASKVRDKFRSPSRTENSWVPLESNLVSFNRRAEADILAAPRRKVDVQVVARRDDPMPQRSQMTVLAPQAQITDGVVGHAETGAEHPEGPEDCWDTAGAVH